MKSVSKYNVDFGLDVPSLHVILLRSTYNQVENRVICTAPT